MKIKVKINDAAHWPITYQDKEVEIEVTGIKWPDGSYWGCEGLIGMSLASPEAPQSSSQSSFIGALGEKPKRIEVHF